MDEVVICLAGSSPDWGQAAKRATACRKRLAESFVFCSHRRMPFVIIDKAGVPLTDSAGNLFIRASRDEAARWTTSGERVEPYIPRRHDRETGVGKKIGHFAAS